jgi:CelD/BcsL family acetyltransferase involved in cellulose biosynthesis
VGIAENVGEMATSVATRTRPVEVHRDPAEVVEEWTALAERAGAPPFAHPGWFEAWYEAFGHRPQILTVRRFGELVGVLPLQRHHRALCSAANWHSPAFAPLAADEDGMARLLHAMLAQGAPRYDLMMLEAAHPALGFLHGTGRRVAERVIARQPYVDTSGMWADYDSALPRKHRKELRRQRRRLEELGSVELEFVSGAEQLDALLDEGFAIEDSGWKTGTAIASDPAIERFYRRVAHWADERGWLTLAFLRLDGRAIAFDLCLEAGGAAYVLKGGFAQECRRFAPGSLLTYESLARAFASPALHSYEFLGDDDRYKLVWTDSARERVRVQTFAPTPGGLASFVAWTHGRQAVKRAVPARRRR